MTTTRRTTHTTTTSGNGSGMAFARKVQLITTAAIGVLTLIGTLHLLMLRAILQPAIADSMDQVARESAGRDSLLLLRINANTAALTQMSRDRIILVTILETPPGPSRQAFIAALKEQWTIDARHEYGSDQ